jgi:catechol 2,3-dioxygenase-like lactoylglutathione lyase family enzyme
MEHDREIIMLANSTIRAVIAAKDLARAQRWYAEKLDLRPLREEAQGLLYQVGSSQFFLYQTSSAGTAQNTVAEFEVADIDAVMADLRRRGVVFEEYDYPNFKTVNGIAMLGSDRAAWFKDSEGNFLALAQRR